MEAVRTTETSVYYETPRAISQKALIFILRRENLKSHTLISTITIGQPFSKSFYPGGTLEIIFRSQETPA
jgi:hypothetical protein